MTKLLIRFFIKNPDDTEIPETRERYGKLAGFVGIASNLALFAAKLLIGFLSGSIAIMADAMNNLTDCASSVITLVGFKLAGMPADDEHPYGHARFEYISGLAVSFLVLVIGYQFLVSSVQKIIHPEDVAFSAVIAMILLLSAMVKLWQGRFNKKVGELIASSALTATAEDSRNDAITTLAVLAGGLIGHLTGLRIDGFMGLLVAVFILISGVKLVRETISPLLGMAPDKRLVAEISKKILSYEGVLGMHDLAVHNYGPGRCFASVHVEFPAHQDILLSHDIADCIERDVADSMQIELVVHLDPIVIDDMRTCELREFVALAAAEIDPRLSTHDFRMVEGRTHTNLIFDVVVPTQFEMPDAELREAFCERIRALSETYYCVIKLDRSYIG